MAYSTQYVLGRKDRNKIQNIEYLKYFEADKVYNYANMSTLKKLGTSGRENHQIDRLKNRLIDRKIDRQIKKIDRQIEKQIDKQKNIQIDISILRQIYLY